MKKISRQFMIALFKIFPLKNHILFESSPDMACNTYPVYQYLLSCHLNDYYQLIWMVKEPTSFNDVKVKNVRFFESKPKNIFKKIHRFYLVSTAKGLIFSNHRFEKHRKIQFSFFLSHSTPIKKTRGIYEIGDTIDMMLCQSPYAKPVTAYEFNVDEKTMVCLGFPRNDALFQRTNEAPKYLTKKSGLKTVFWLPTYRQNRKSHKKDSEALIPYGVPLIETQAQMQRLNAKCAALDLLLVIKPHPYQTPTEVDTSMFDNIKFITDQVLFEQHVQLYTLLGQSSAMITDYSSIYYDYLLTKRPIGLTISDVAEYREKRGFAFENLEDILKGERIASLDDLVVFLDHVKQGNDLYLEAREKISCLFNEPNDEHASQRVGELIISTLKSRFGERK